MYPLIDDELEEAMRQLRLATLCIAMEGKAAHLGHAERLLARAGFQIEQQFKLRAGIERATAQAFAR